MFGPMFLALVWGAFWHGRQMDVVHAHWTLAGIAAWLMAPLTGRPFVLTVHGSDVFLAGRIPLVAAATRAMLRRCRHVFAVSQALREAVITLGADPKRVAVVPNGIDRSLFGPGPEVREPLVLFVGSLIPLKGVDVLLEAVAGLVQTIPAVRVALVGEGPERAALDAKARRLGVAERVTFTGSQTQSQVALWMRQARVFVLPSHQEGLGVVLLEALASGTPCIASRTGGIVDILTSETGILISPGQATELRAGLVDLLTDDRRWQSMSRAGRYYIETQSWTWPRVASVVSDVYHSAGVAPPAS
jgi:glycosyltransferase involved in cell wall biosynthesis